MHTARPNDTKIPLRLPTFPIDQGLFNLVCCQVLSSRGNARYRFIYVYMLDSCLPTNLNICFHMEADTPGVLVELVLTERNI